MPRDVDQRWRRGAPWPGRWFNWPPASRAGVQNASFDGDDTGVHMKKANLELIQARYDAVNAHDFERFQSFYADSVVWRDPGITRPVKGPGGARRRLESWTAAVPNLKWQLDELFGEADRLCAQFTFTGTHKGALTDSRGNELAPTNRAIRLQGVGVYAVNDGKIVNSRIYFDLAGFGAPQRTS